MSVLRRPLAGLVLLAALPVAAQAPRPVSLDEALGAGRRAATQAVLARLDAAIANGKVGLRRAAVLPSIGTRLSGERQTFNADEFGFRNFTGVTDPFTVLRARVSVSQVLFDRGAFEEVATARDSVVAAEADADHAGDVGELTAGLAWLRLARAEETVKAREADSVTAAELFDVARQQVEAGTAARIEQTRTATRVAVTRGQLSEARHEVKRAAIDLARAMRLSPGTALATSGDPVVTFDVPTDADSAVALAEAQRRDLAAATARLEVAERKVGASRFAWWPSLVAGGYWQESGQRFDGLSATWNVGVALQWSPFDGFRRQRETDQARLRAEAARVRRADLREAVDADARRATLDIASATEQVAIATDRLALATEELREAEERFTAGVTGSVETTTAQAGVTAARDALIQARMSLGAARVAAAGALGLLTPTNAPAAAGEQ